MDLLASYVNNIVISSQHHHHSYIRTTHRRSDRQQITHTKSKVYFDHVMYIKTLCYIEYHVVADTYIGIPSAILFSLNGKISSLFKQSVYVYIKSRELDVCMLLQL